jgi:hypothetical protein
VILRADRLDLFVPDLLILDLFMLILDLFMLV